MAYLKMHVARLCLRKLSPPETSAEDVGWGKNGAINTPIYAIQCPLCIYATCLEQASQPVTTGLSPKIPHILLHNRGVSDAT